MTLPRSLTTITLAATALALSFVSGLAAQSPATTDADVETSAPTGALFIGFVDVELVIDRSRAIRGALDHIDREMAAKAREIDELDRRVRRNQLELDRQQAVLSASELDRLRSEILESTDDLQRRRFEFEQDLRSRERQLEPVLQKIMEVVADVADREGYEIVLRGEVVLYGAKSADLTPLVVRELDSKADEVLELFRLGAGTVNLDEVTTGTERRAGGMAPGRPSSEALPLIP